MINTENPPEKPLSLEEFICQEKISTQKLISQKYHLFLDALLAWKFEQKRTNKTSNAISTSLAQVIEQLDKMQLGIENFTFCKMLSKGAFGEVFLVREKFQGKHYAIKVLKKINMLNQKDTAFFMEECEVMQKAKDYEWLMNVIFAFQDAYNLYFLMDYYSSGDLMNLLCSSEEGCLGEEQVCFYAAEIVLALEELHRMGFVHRDVKPDNLLIDKEGHLRLTDFGSCGRLLDGKIYCSSTVGTPDYIAPEVLLSKENGGAHYGTECDIWSLGIVIYEMLFGNGPFYSERLIQTYSSIINHKEIFCIPEQPEISENAKHLLRNLICDKEERLTVEEIKKHPFFESIQWNTMKETVPPFVPSPTEEDDFSAFLDTCSDDVAIPTSNIPAGTQCNFIGYTCGEIDSSCKGGRQELLSLQCNPIEESQNNPIEESTETKSNPIEETIGKISQKEPKKSLYGSKSVLFGSASSLTTSNSIFRSNSSALLLQTCQSNSSFAKEERKNYKLLLQEYKSLEQRFNNEVAKRLEFEEKLAKANNSEIHNQYFSKKEIPQYIIQEILLGDHSSQDFEISSGFTCLSNGGNSTSSKSSDFFSFFKKASTSIHLRNGKLMVKQKKGSKASQSVDFILDLTDESICLRAYRKEGYYCLDLVKLAANLTCKCNASLSAEDFTYKITKCTSLIKREDAFLAGLRNISRVNAPDSRQKSQLQQEITQSEMRLFFYKQEYAQLLKNAKKTTIEDHNNANQKCNALLEEPNDSSSASIVSQYSASIEFYGHAFSNGAAGNFAASMVSVLDGSGGQFECMICDKLFASQISTSKSTNHPTVPHGKSSQTLYSCTCCGCKCHADCIPFVNMSCEEWAEFLMKEPFFALNTKSRESFLRWSHLLSLSIKLRL